MFEFCNIGKRCSEGESEEEEDWCMVAPRPSATSSHLVKVRV
jgi:hypothetical protein